MFLIMQAMQIMPVHVFCFFFANINANTLNQQFSRKPKFEMFDMPTVNHVRIIVLEKPLVMKGNL
jgi:hypothetical protein